MKRANRILIMAMLLSFVACQPAPKKQESRAIKPKLIVGIVVDQMRNDFISRYWEKYGDGGFKRLVNGGYYCKNTHFNYVPTYTGPGHASVYTGATPAVHGIIANYWYEISRGKGTYCVADSTVKPLGIPDVETARRSPRYMKTNTITDALRMSSEFESKVIGISVKDRGAILPAGHSANGAYWYNGASGKWISSSYYMPELPEWVVGFNDQELPAKYLSKPWETLLPIESYTESLPDKNPYEGVYPGEEHPVFPHDLPAITAEVGLSILGNTPFGNTLTSEFAKAAVDAEALGQGSATDFLAISFSCTDKVGHQFGPRAIETEDTYLRLDKDLEELLIHLDMKVGKGNYLVFLTADHGVAEVPAHMMAHKMPGGYFEPRELKRSIGQIATDLFGSDEIIASVSNTQVFLDPTYMEKNKLEQKQVEEELVKAILKMDGIAGAIRGEDLLTGNFGEGFYTLVQNGYHPKYSGNIMLLLQPGWLEYEHTGSSHGSSYAYDTHVPLVWYGAGISHGSNHHYTTITQIVPTLAAMLDIELPMGSSNEPIEPIIK